MFEKKNDDLSPIETADAAGAQRMYVNFLPEFATVLPILHTLFLTYADIFSNKKYRDLNYIK
jgi:hypothetical protein